MFKPRPRGQDPGGRPPALLPPRLALEGTWRVPGEYLGGTWGVPGEYLEGTWGAPERCLEGAWVVAPGPLSIPEGSGCPLAMLGAWQRDSGQGGRKHRSSLTQESPPPRPGRAAWPPSLQGRPERPLPHTLLPPLGQGSLAGRGAPGLSLPTPEASTTVWGTVGMTLTPSPSRCTWSSSAGPAQGPAWSPACSQARPLPVWVGLPNYSLSAGQARAGGGRAGIPDPTSPLLLVIPGSSSEPPLLVMGPQHRPHPHSCGQTGPSPSRSPSWPEASLCAVLGGQVTFPASHTALQTQAPASHPAGPSSSVSLARAGGDWAPRLPGLGLLTVPPVYPKTVSQDTEREAAVLLWGVRARVCACVHASVHVRVEHFAPDVASLALTPLLGHGDLAHAHMHAGAKAQQSRVWSLGPCAALGRRGTRRCGWGLLFTCRFLPVYPEPPTARPCQPLAPVLLREGPQALRASPALPSPAQPW